MKKTFLRISLVFAIILSISSVSSPAWSLKLTINPASISLAESQSALVTMTLDEPIICPDMDETCKVDIDLSTNSSTRISLDTTSISIPYDEWALPVQFVVTNISDLNANTNSVETIKAEITSNSEYYDGFTASRDVTVTDIDSGDVPVATYSNGNSEISAKPGEQITISGSDFKTNTTATATMYSTPQLLGTFTTSTTGTFSGLVTIPTSTSTGSHTIVVAGTNNAGANVSITLNLNVTKPAAALAATGSESKTITFTSIFLIFFGLILLRLSNNKKRFYF